MNTKILFIIGGVFLIFSSTTFFVKETQREKWYFNLEKLKEMT